MLSTVDFKIVAFLESHVSDQKSGQSSQSTTGGAVQWRVINDVAVYLLGDEDHRVRSAAGQALVKSVLCFMQSYVVPFDVI